jgi:chromatin remodeling complex protein RSC6
MGKNKNTTVETHSEEVKQTKKSTKVEEPVVATPPPAADKKSKKEKKADTPAPVAAPAPVVEAPAQEAGESSEASVEQTLFETLSTLTKELNSHLDQAKKLQVAVKQFEKLLHKSVKDLKKNNKRRKGGKSGKKGEMPKGFTVPCKLSDALCTFLGVPKATQLSRNEVRSKITEYVASNSLKDKNNGQKINPDAKLTKLFGLEKDAQLTIFNIHKYLSSHIESVSA